MMMVKRGYELRLYITYAEPILWPRIIVGIRNHLNYPIVLNMMGRGEEKIVRCTKIMALRQSLTRA